MSNNNILVLGGHTDSESGQFVATQSIVVRERDLPTLMRQNDTLRACKRIITRPARGLSPEFPLTPANG